MAFALVGTAGAVTTGAASAAVTPAFGAGENRAAGNLLVCWVSGSGHSAPINLSPGWSLAAFIGNGAAFDCSAIFWRIAEGADVAPTVSAVSGMTYSIRVAEFAGNGSLPLDVTSTVAGSTSSPQTLTAGSNDGAPGELVLYAASVNYSVATVPTITSSLNNGATDTSVNNNATSTAAHYILGFGITTGNDAADAETLTFTTTNSTGTSVVLVSFGFAQYVPLRAVLPRNTLGRGIRNRGQMAMFQDRVATPPVASGPQTFFQALAASSTSAATFARIINTAILASSTSTISVALGTAKTLAAVGAGSASLVRRAGKVLAVASTGAVFLVRQAGKVLLALSTNAVTLSRLVSKSLVALSSGVVSVAKRVGKTLAGSSTGTASVATLKVILRTLTATATGTASLAKSVGKGIVAASTATPALVRRVGKGLAVSAVGTASVAKRVGKALGGTSVGSAILSTVKNFFGGFTAVPPPTDLSLDANTTNLVLDSSTLDMVLDAATTDMVLDAFTSDMVLNPSTTDMLLDAQVTNVTLDDNATNLTLDD